jgi:hypothetical protein
MKFDPDQLRQYREKAAEVSELRKTLGEKLGQEEIGRMQRDFEALKVSTKQFDDLRNALGAAGVFLARYGVEVVNDHTVSFVIPRGVSRIDIMHGAQQLVTEQALFDEETYNYYARNEKFRTPATHSEKICIDGRVEGLDGKTRGEQESALQERGLTLAIYEDIPVAFAVFWVATGKPLFGWLKDLDGDECPFTPMPRASRGAFYFDRDGLCCISDNPTYEENDIAVAACVSRESEAESTE